MDTNGELLFAFNLIFFTTEEAAQEQNKNEGKSSHYFLLWQKTSEEGTEKVINLSLRGLDTPLLKRIRLWKEGRRKKKKVDLKHICARYEKHENTG